MGDLKNKFMDIFFEDEPETVLDDSVKEKPVEVKPVEKKLESGIKASDILYHKSSNKSSAFINLDDNQKTVDDYMNINEPYEMSSQISPIFGVLNSEAKKTVSSNVEVNEAQTSKPSDSHLDIITSPIYGYSKSQDYVVEEDNNYEVNNYTNDENDQLHNLFDDKRNTNENITYADDDEEISLFRLFGDNK